MERTSEAFELLALSKSTSSDEESPVRIVKKKQKRHRSKSGNTYRVKGQREQNGSNNNKLLFSASSLFGFGLVGWVLILTWFAVQLRLEMQYLTSLTSKVTAGNQEIPDDIQKLHTLTKQLEQNQTHIITELQQVAQNLTDFSNMIRGIESGLSSVKKKLNDSPDLVSIPKKLQELIHTLANIGGQLTDFNITTMRVSNEQKKISDQIDSINKNLSFYNILQEELQDVKNDSYRKTVQSSGNKSEALLQTVLDYITPNISSLNLTVWKKIDEIVNSQRESQETINNFKAHLETAQEGEEDLCKKVLSNITEKTDSLQAAVENCNHVSDLKMELLRNLTHQVATCTCKGGNSTEDLQVLSTPSEAVTTK